MAKIRGKTISSRFLRPQPDSPTREIYPGGDWVRIQEDLKLSEFTFLQREYIHKLLRSGIPLSTAIKKAFNVSGKCPMKSKRFI